MRARYSLVGVVAVLVMACGGSNGGDGHGSSSGGAGGDAGGSATGGRNTGGSEASSGGLASLAGSGGEGETGGVLGSAGLGAAGVLSTGGTLGGGGIVAGGTLGGGGIVVGGAGAVSGVPTAGTSSSVGGAGAGAPAASGGDGGSPAPGAAGSTQGGFAGDLVDAGPGGAGGEAGTSVGQPGGTAGAPVVPIGGSAGAAGSETQPTVCGGLAGLECLSRDEYCRYAAGTCNMTDRTGVCLERPTVCATSWRPVCGCDGVTYPNACEADRAAMSIAHEGSCEGDEARRCAGVLGLRCPAGTLCLYTMGFCNVVDLGGQCYATPQGCPAQRDPVCGCDGVTYANECQALLEGALLLDHTGACR